jgi:hypothetical protein
MFHIWDPYQANLEVNLEECGAVVAGRRYITNPGDPWLLSVTHPRQKALSDFHNKIPVIYKRCVERFHWRSFPPWRSVSAFSTIATLFRPYEVLRAV